LIIQIQLVKMADVDKVLVRLKWLKYLKKLEEDIYYTRKPFICDVGKSYHHTILNPTIATLRAFTAISHKSCDVVSRIRKEG
jgi:hypothetical protein